VDGRGRPWSICLSPGQRHESTQLEPLLDGLPGIPGRVVGDKGYSYPRVRSFLAERGIEATIPTRKDQPRNPEFDKELYRQRNIVERAFARLKQWRCVATRYDKRSRNYRAQIVLAAIMIWLPYLPTQSPDTP
jgi:transposase